MENNYLNIIPKDLKNNYLNSYEEQHKKDKSYFNIILEQIIINLEELKFKDNEVELNIISTLLNKYNINVSFGTNTANEITYNFEDLNVISLELIIDLLSLYIKYIKRFKNDDRDSLQLQIMRYITFANRDLSKYNIPLRIVALGYENSDSIPGDLQIVKVEVKKEIDA